VTTYIERPENSELKTNLDEALEDAHTAKDNVKEVTQEAEEVTLEIYKKLEKRLQDRGVID